MYRAFAKLGFTPPQVDAMEPWQAAALLGMDKGEDDSIQARLAREGDTLAERAARIREMRGKPVPESDDITDMVMRQMGILTP